MDLVNESKIGICLGTCVIDEVGNEFKGESWEVGIYLAMARQAHREGLPEIAIVLKEIALEEANHAALFAELSGRISTSTKENIEKMLAGEISANKGKREAAMKAKDAGLDHAHDILDETSRDEGRHARALQGLLNRYFK
ncbi:MAG: rubrerythrin family protein [Dethiobacter sp.]|nr:rubrerythrin family protein [Dethiobacter sp.]MBS3983433.1 rubrerythrin family protein [Dethiobacter sp.]MCL4462474.1 rubrerythrin family protein [Bacillota bacterium]MCL5993715.1 rubrerythrin family protein [Bacillota bacterium]